MKLTRRQLWKKYLEAERKSERAKEAANKIWSEWYSRGRRQKKRQAIWNQGNKSSIEKQVIHKKDREATQLKESVCRMVGAQMKYHRPRITKLKIVVTRIVYGPIKRIWWSKTKKEDTDKYPEMDVFIDDCPRTK